VIFVHWGHATIRLAANVSPACAVDAGQVGCGLGRRQRWQKGCHIVEASFDIRRAHDAGALRWCVMVVTVEVLHAVTEEAIRATCGIQFSNAGGKRQ
jgi:hypothetical protein